MPLEKLEKISFKQIPLFNRYPGRTHFPTSNTKRLKLLRAFYKLNPHLKRQKGLYKLRGKQATKVLTDLMAEYNLTPQNVLPKTRQYDYLGRPL